MSWLLEIVESTFGALFDSAREGTMRDQRRSGWPRGSLVISYYVLPTLFLVSICFSWKPSLIVAVVFIVSLIAGAMTEEDDPEFR